MKSKTGREFVCSLLVLVAIGAVIVLVQPTLALLGSVNAQGVSKPMGNGFSLTFSKAFSPSTIGSGTPPNASTSTLTFTLTNPESTPASDLAFTDTLPSGITIATPASAFTDCTNATLSAPDGGTTITFSGGTLGADLDTCTASVNVAGTMTAMNPPISLMGTIGGVGASGSSATATLTVSDARPGFSKAFSPDTIPPGGTSTLTFTIDNNDEVLKSSLSFTDPLPAGMVIATPPPTLLTPAAELSPPSPERPSSPWVLAFSRGARAVPSASTSPPPPPACSSTPR